MGRGFKGCVRFEVAGFGIRVVEDVLSTATRLSTKTQGYNRPRAGGVGVGSWERDMHGSLVWSCSIKSEIEDCDKTHMKKVRNFQSSLYVITVEPSADNCALRKQLFSLP